MIQIMKQTGIIGNLQVDFRLFQSGQGTSKAVAEPIKISGDHGVQVPLQGRGIAFSLTGAVGSRSRFAGFLFSGFGLTEQPTH